MFESLPDYSPGGNVPPVRECAPMMIAPRLEYPEGTLRRSVDILRHDTKAPVHPTNRGLFEDGAPRVGAFDQR
eukprot:5233862-Alexandrium_andersonii.AAC.1